MDFLASVLSLAAIGVDVLSALRIELLAASGVVESVLSTCGQNLATVVKLVDAEKVEDWVGWGGPWVVFGLLFLCGLGLPLPEEIPIMAAGYFIGTGQMGWVFTCVLAWCGVIGGDCCLYWFGRRYGLNITRVKFIGKHFTQERILRAEQLFERWGVWVVAIGRLISGIRGVMCVAAGAIRYNFGKFLLVDGLAALVSGGIFVFLGWWLGQTLGDFDAAVKKVEPYVELFVLVLLLLILIGAAYLYIRHRRHKGVTDVALGKAVEFAEKHHHHTDGRPHEGKRVEAVGE